jgi:hypothetical protein
LSCASPGFGYDEAVALTGGEFVDICTDDWPASLRLMAEHSLSPYANALTLEADPIVDTLVVEVDRVVWKSGWYYTGRLADGGTNEIRFDLETFPLAGSRIEASYSVQPVCD